MNSNRLNYKVLGKGYPVVFLHGFLESLTMWEYLKISNFPFMSILIDLPGHGASLNEDDKEPSIDFMAFKVQEVLSDLKINNFSVVGHSMGGYVSLFLKENSTNGFKDSLNCEKVILLNSNFWIDSIQKKIDRLRVAEIVFKNKELFLQTAIPNLFNEPSSYKNQIRKLLEEAILIDEHSIAYSSLAMRNRDYFGSLVKKKPKDFLIIQGEKDTIISFLMMENELKGIPVSYIKIKNVGHMAHIESPKIVENVICDFILKLY
jgi:pimeloyl-ACP methyl ester carboxylesterase